MDAKKRWAWLPGQMPGVARLLERKRAEVGAAWVAECWKHGVVQCEPGWFFATEGALHVGVLWPEAMALMGEVQRQLDELKSLAGPYEAERPALVLLRPQEVRDGA